MKKMSLNQAVKVVQSGTKNYVQMTYIIYIYIVYKYNVYIQKKIHKIYELLYLVSYLFIH